MNKQVVLKTPPHERNIQHVLYAKACKFVGGHALPRTENNACEKLGLADTAETRSRRETVVELTIAGTGEKFLWEYDHSRNS
jgi:hypothetical protein